MAIPSVDDFLDGIRDKLEGETVRSHNGSKRFVTKHSQELVWKESDNLWALSRFAKLRFDNTLLLEKNFLQTISILVSIGWREWTRFGDIFIDHRDTNGNRDRTDIAIPKYTFELLAQPGFLGKPRPARNFVEERYAFCPIVVREGTSLTLEKGWRLPFIEEEVEIGRGSYGAVTKEVIAVRHFQSGSGESSLFNQEPYAVARKTFDASSEEDFRKEIENLGLLRNALSTHSRIAPFLATLTIGTDFHILSKIAVMDLDRFLHTDHTNSAKFTVTLENMMSEVRHLADAIHHLHDNIKIQESGLHLSCCHMDLKPENILVYMEENAPVGVWKISDFGISSIKESVRNSEARPPKSNNNLQVPKTFADLREKGYLTSKTARTNPRRGSGTWQAPEVHRNSEKISPQKVDVWSYGCIFVQVLACGLGGLKELVALDEKRKKGDDGKSYADDCFYRAVIGEKYTINPHIEKWVSALPRRSDLGINPRFLPNCSNLILLMLKIDPKDRLSAGDITKILYKINETSIDRILAPVIHHPRDELPQTLGNVSIRGSAIPDVATHTEELDLMAARSHIGEESPSTLDSVGGSQIETATSHVHCAPATSFPSPLGTNSPPRRRLASIPPSTSTNFATPLPQPRGECTQESQETVVSTNLNSRRSSFASLRCSSSPEIMRQSFGTGSKTPRIVVGEQRMENQRSQQSQEAEETIDPIRRIQTGPSSISLPFTDNSSPQLNADIPYPRTPRQKSVPRASTFDLAKNGLPGFNQQSQFPPSPPWQSRSSEESQFRPSGRVSNAGTVPSQIGYPESTAPDATIVLTFDVPRDVIQTVLSPKGSKIAFVAHSALYIYATTNQRSKYHVPPPTGHELEWQWLGASLSEGFLLTRGHSLRDRRTILSLWTVTYHFDEYGAGKLCVECRKSMDRDSDGVPYLDGVVADAVTNPATAEEEYEAHSVPSDTVGLSPSLIPRDCYLLLQTSGSVTLKNTSSRDRGPVKLKVVGMTAKPWFNASGSHAFTWSIDGQDHHINVWSVEDAKIHYHYNYRVADRDNYGTPVKDVVSFPRKPSFVMEKHQSRISIVDPPLFEASQRISDTSPPSWVRSRLQALAVSPDEEAFFYVCDQTNFISRVSKLYKAQILKKDNDRFSIRDGTSGSGIKLNVPLSEGSTMYAIKDDREYQTRVLIAHCNGKVEEIIA